MSNSLIADRRWLRIGHDSGAFLASAFVRDGRTIILGSDRDSGLWIFEDTEP